MTNVIIIDNAIHLKKAVLTLHPEGYVIMEIKTGEYLEKKDAEELIEAHKMLTPDRSALLILHTDNYSVDKDAQFVFSNDNFPTAIAIVAKTSMANMSLNILFKLFTIMKKKFIPRKIFWTEEEAVDWLKSISQSA